jgi:predicted phage baseplate assembly protein
MTLNDCGCCEGVAVETPVEISNRPGLTAIAYRIGTHGQFKASMLARLSESALPELRRLKTREGDDFTIALLDSWALVSDVLTFYQERIANESYLRTATERSSIINLARLIGYELRPGVAASTYLAFTLETAPGSPAAATLAERLRVQSIPGPGQKPQSFETVEQIEARAEWNALKPQQSELRYPVFGSTHAYLSGVTTNLKPGDSLLVVGAERLGDKDNENWEIRRVSSVTPDAANKRTLVYWGEPLGSRIPHVEPPRKGPKIYALRLHASLFGFNAQNWSALPVALRIGEANPDPEAKKNNEFLEGAFAGRKDSWADARLPAGIKTINLDSVYNQIILNSWIVLVKPATTDPETSAYAEVYRVRSVGEEVVTDFNMSAKTTRLTITGEHIHKFSPRDTTVLAQSEELALAETPLDEPVSGDEITLDHVLEGGLASGRTLIVAGTRIRAVIGTTRAKLYLTSEDGSQKVSLAAGDNLIVLGPPVNLVEKPGQQSWRLMDKTGFEGYVQAATDKIIFAPAEAADDVVNEVVQLDEATLAEDKEHTILKLTAPLTNVYDRSSVTIFANVALSTHGETVKGEVLGSGNAGQPYQRFSLRQSPLTYVGADTPSGGESTLEVRVNDLLWSEVSTFFGRGPRERIYVTHTDDGGRTTVQFGDGETGARLPIGRENVNATYRKGIGLDGLMNAGQLSLLMTRPLGVKGVTNPLPAAGAQDPQSLSDARANAPLTVLTLDRIVSLRDYEDFARSFSGIAKAVAAWTWNGHTRGVFITVAGIDGAEVADGSILSTNLVSAILKAGDSFVPVKVASYRGMTFRLAADIKVDEQYIEATVLANVESALRSAFSFEARAFGRSVVLSEVIAVIQNVAGVVAVDVNKLHRSDQKKSLRAILPAAAPRDGDDAGVAAAQLLTLDPGPLELGVMS